MSLWIKWTWFVVQVRITVLAAANRWHLRKAQEKAKCIRNSLQHTWMSNNMQQGTKPEMVVSYSPSTHSMDLPWGFRLVQYSTLFTYVTNSHKYSWKDLVFKHPRSLMSGPHATSDMHQLEALTQPTTNRWVCCTAPAWTADNLQT